MDKNTQQPVAWRVFRSATEYELFISEYNARQRAKQLGSSAVQPLYTAPPVPREVLMAFGAEVAYKAHYAGLICNLFTDEDISAIADRYASKHAGVVALRVLLGEETACPASESPTA